MFKSVVNGFQIVVAILAGATVVLLLTLSPQPPATAKAASDSSAGQAVFASSCAGCHGVDRTGGVGPALAGEGALSRFEDPESVAKFVSSGAPGRMPGFETRLTPDEIAAVAALVWDGKDQ